MLEKLQQHHLTPNPQASRIDLIRRVTFDLTGLPPTPEEVQAFLNDKSDDAYEHLVDRLLASPHYGERWARHWLDLARYADSDGFENDTRSAVRLQVSRLRDSQFQRRQAVRPVSCRSNWPATKWMPGNPENLIALGFCRNGPTIGNQNNEKNRVDEVDDMVSTTGAVFLGLTVGCARCHDHKYEPISAARLLSHVRRVQNAEKANADEIMHVRDPAARARKTYMMLGGDCTRHGEEVRARRAGGDG